jgi:hypothetical protein
LHAEVVGEELLLEDGERGAREYFEGYDAGEEGVEYGGTEEGAVAIGVGKLVYPMYLTAGVTAIHT